MLIESARAVYRLRYVARARWLRRRTVEHLPALFSARTTVEPSELRLPPLHCALSGTRISRGRRYRFLPPALGVVEKARIVPDSGYVLDQKSRIVCPPHFHTRLLSDVLNPRAIFQAAARPPSIELASAYYLLGPWHRNYYHWLIDYCPLLQTFAEHRQAFPEHPEPVLLLPRGLPPTYRELLSLLWPGECRFEWCGEIMTIERLFVHSPHKGISWPRLIEGAPLSLPSIRWLQNGIGPHLREKPPLRLLISRSRAPIRRIANEEELFTALAPLGFQRVFLEEHAFVEQASLFRSAEAVIGCHGAGFANLVFCREGTRVIEIYPPGTTRVDYHSISRVMGLKYRGVLAKAPPQEGNIWDCNVDAPALRQLVCRLLDSGEPRQP